MTRREQVREYVEFLERHAEEERGWDQPAELHRMYYDMRLDKVATAIVPLHFLSGSPPEALEMIAHGLETKQFPPQVWPRVGEFGLFVMHEAWLTRPQTWSDEFTAEYVAATKDIDTSSDEGYRKHTRAVSALYRKHYGEGWSVSQIQGSVEIRQIMCIVGKKFMVYQRVRGEEPMWVSEGEGGMEEYIPAGRVHDALLAIQRASRVAQ